ncbi:MAG: hypothetical protein EPO32_06260 [Anaerolineae bacterium]|nr:MAG: hypothetical protein EPO32_06260 [Anaerolineae bacterium]
MRTLEVLILLLNVVALVALYLPRRAALRGLAYLPAVTVIVMLAHLGVEGYRWQMVPAYLLTAALFLLSLRRMRNRGDVPPARGALAFAAGGLAAVVWVAAAALPIILPVPRLPQPPGPYAVGSVLYHWMDTTRDEVYSTEPDDSREMMVQIWYPADVTADARTVPFLDNFDVALPAFAAFLEVPPFVLEHLQLVDTHSYADVPASGGESSYPVVIYSHGYKSYRTASIAQMEALASSGYIAVAIDHPYSAAFTVFPDGRVALNDPDLLPPDGRMEPGDQEAREGLQGTMVADVQFVLDQLQRLNEGGLESPLAGKLDLERVGLTGVSTGGGAILWACQIDARCKAGLVQDGWYEPIPEALVTQPLRQPFLFMQSETDMWMMDNLARLDGLYVESAAPAFHLSLTGVQHYDFGDYPLLSPVNSLLPEHGTMEGKRTVAMINAYLLAFFDQYLKGEPSVLLAGPSAEYPEVGFEGREP